MHDADRIRDAAARFKSALKAHPEPMAWVGLDGFVDQIVRVVDMRTSADEYTPIATIGQYASRLAAAAGKSTNVELVTQQVKLGGNGPLMGEALGRLGARLNYVGSVGAPDMDPTFLPLRNYGEVTPIARPGVTIAAEFDDGKIMHGRMEGLREVTFDNLVAGSGGADALRDAIAAADVMALVNWTMLPHMTSILRSVRPMMRGLAEKAPRVIFFDLCDPAKRPVEDLADAVEVMASFSTEHTTAILGLNEAESEQVARAVGVDPGDNTAEALIHRARTIAEKIAISEVVIHPTRLAGAWGREGSGHIHGPFCRAPKLTTGAGDHFNGGYVFGRTIGLSPADALVVGKATSGFYVRNCRGPAAEELVLFCEHWASNALDS